MADKMPLIAAGDRDTFGSAREATPFYDVDAQAQDVTFVPGYSEKRRHNAFADTDQGRQRGMKKVRIDYRLHWARSSTPMGKPDARDLTAHLAQGYKFVTKDNLASLGFQEPPSATVDPATGRYTLGDAVLMYCPRDVAARNENVLRRATEERSSADATAAHLHTEGGVLAKQTGQSGLTESTVSHEAEVRRK